jgi:hypothetical protein
LASAFTSIGFNFRNTPGYVTDGANEVMVYGAYDNYLSHLVAGDGSAADCGWEFAIYQADRSTSNDRRLAGINYYNGAVKFRVDLPSTGNWDIRVAMGDQAWYWYEGFQILDNTTVVKDVDASTKAANYFLDSQGNQWSEAAWPGSNVKFTYNFTSTIFYLEIKGTSGYTAIAHLDIAQSGGGAPTFQPAWARGSNILLPGTW